MPENKIKLWKMKVTVISFVVGALGTIPKTLVKGLKDLEIRILRKVLETWGDLLLL